MNTEVKLVRAGENPLSFLSPHNRRGIACVSWTYRTRELLIIRGGGSSILLRRTSRRTDSPITNDVGG